MSEAVKHDLLGRLARLGPLPDDATISQAQLDEFGDIVDRISMALPDREYVRPLLDTFGYGDGFGGYTHGMHALLQQDRDTVVGAALDVLEIGRDGQRQWAMEALRRLREGDRGNPSPSAREVSLTETALRLPPLVAEAAVWWAYWVDGLIGRRVLELGSRVATGEARTRAAELLTGAPG